ncbi:MAG TPA: FTR1 family iron permease [Gammaproteobacteria bacterium]|nr:FTR1 family iron permease [Gammaproteobacteria bacterium]
MGNTVFIVWRESVEAMLVIGILHAWLSSRAEARAGLRFLWGGVVAGLGLAGLLALVMLKVQGELAGEAMEYFQIGMMLLAAGLITQMVFWMRRHGRTLKRELEAGMDRALERASWWGMATLAALAVGREGAETVIFLYGMGMARGGAGQAAFWGSAALGFGAALLTFWLLSRGGRLFSWRAFFRFSEAVLLLLAGALLVEGVDRMFGMGWLPPLLDPLWDSSALLDDSTRIGSLVAALTGYRAQPALLVVLVYAAYWMLVLFMLRRPQRLQQKTTRTVEAG